MKTIAQLLTLSENPNYTLTPEEQAKLDDFLSKNSEQRKSQKTSSNDSEKNIPATVHNKNIVHAETGVLPTADQVAAGQALAEGPATSVGSEPA